MCVLIEDIGRRPLLQLQYSYQGQQGDVSQSVRLFHALHISEAGSVRVSQWLQREHAADIVSHLTGPGCFIELKYNKKRTRQTKGSVGVCSDLSYRNMMNEARTPIH